MSRYKAMFERLKAANEAAFVPFTMLGDPNPQQSLLVLESFVKAGADALELGLPFSDPVADGPTIQAAANRVLEAGLTPNRALEIVARFRQKNDHTPIGLLVYANLVIQGGRDSFYKRMAELGVDSVLVADVPSREIDPFAESARKYGVDPVLIAAPNSSPRQLKKIAEVCSGYTYVVSRAGVTGTEVKAGLDHRSLLQQLTKLEAPPALLGFGISTPQHVRRAIESGARGAICGSAIVSRMAAAKNDSERLNTVESFVRSMKEATKA